MKYKKIILSIESQHTPSILFLFGVMHLVHLLGKGTCGEEEHQGAGLSLCNKMPREGLLQGHDEQAHAVASLVGVNSQDYCSSGLESILTHIGYQHLGPFNVSSMDGKSTGASYSTQEKLPDLISESMDHVPSQSLGLANFGSVSSLQRFKNSINSGFNMLGGARSRLERSGRDHDHHLALAAVRMKKDKGRRKMREPRFCFKTRSDVDVLDDGYKWRKYGQKVVKNTLHPRSYYRCTQDNCRVKKKVERLAEDPRMVITTYEGRHAHSPSHEQNDDSNSFNPPASIPHHFKLFW